MKFLIDAQLPPSLKRVFTANGHDCIHTSDLEMKNETSDKVINALSVAEQRILITKDEDFLDSFLIKKEPYKLILIKLGNTSKSELISFFSEKFNEIMEMISIESMIVLKK